MQAETSLSSGNERPFVRISALYRWKCAALNGTTLLSPFGVTLSYGYGTPDGPCLFSLRRDALCLFRRRHVRIFLLEQLAFLPKNWCVPLAFELTNLELVLRTPQPWNVFLRQCISRALIGLLSSTVVGARDLSLSLLSTSSVAFSPYRERTKRIPFWPRNPEFQLQLTTNGRDFRAANVHMRRISPPQAQLTAALQSLCCWAVIRNTRGGNHPVFGGAVASLCPHKRL